MAHASNFSFIQYTLCYTHSFHMKAVSLINQSYEAYLIPHHTTSWLLANSLQLGACTPGSKITITHNESVAS